MADDERLGVSSLFNVKGLIAVITGGGSGLGAVMARALALNGAEAVFIIGRRGEALQRVASSVPGGVIKPIVGDVTSKASLEECVHFVKGHVDRVDCLIANSGIAGPTAHMKDPVTSDVLPFEQLYTNLWSPEPADVTSTYAVNLTGVHFFIAAFLPLLYSASQSRTQQPSSGPTARLRPRPQIITVSSAGAFGRQPLANLSYQPSKSGVVTMAKVLATTLAPYGIRSNNIAPGIYYTEMTDEVFANAGMQDPSQIKEEGAFPVTLVPETRSGADEDMAGLILYMASRAGAYLNGSVLLTDGGWMSAVPSSY